MKGSNYGPFYAAGLYPALSDLFRRHGYALAIHGSVASDLDLIAVPWVEDAKDPAEVIAHVQKAYGSTFAERDKEPCVPQPKPLGRIAYKVHMSFGHCALDISFTPKVLP
jgi:hypothetical protein